MTAFARALALSIATTLLALMTCNPTAEARGQPVVTAATPSPTPLSSQAGDPAQTPPTPSTPATTTEAKPTVPLAHATGATVSKPAATPASAEPKTAGVVRTALILSLMAFLPAILICTTSFTRFVVVLSMIRHGLGMPETPPNQVLLSLALFLTLFSMAPTFEAINGQALQPFLSGRLTANEAAVKGSEPLRRFMLRQVHDQDIKAVYDMSHEPLPDSAADVSFMRLVPAFMLNELRVAFRIGFVILLPFLLIDIVVSSILLALGMLMVPPSTLSLPIKVLMFVLIDGWSLVLQGVVGSIH